MPVGLALSKHNQKLLKQLDRLDASDSVNSLRRVEDSLETLLEAEKEVLFPAYDRCGGTSRHGEDEHAVIRFALQRLSAATDARQRAPRSRVLRDILVHHLEQTEHIVVETLRSHLRSKAWQVLGKRMEEALTKRAVRRSPTK